MSKQHLSVSIITPSGKLFESKEAEMVSAHSTQGWISILPQHVPLFTKLEQDEVKVRVDGNDSFFTIFQGFLNLAPGNQLTIMADVAQRSETLHMEAILKAKTAAEKALSEKDKLSATEILRAETAMRRTIMELRVAERHQRIR